MKSSQASSPFFEQSSLQLWLAKTLADHGINNITAVVFTSLLSITLGFPCSDRESRYLATCQLLSATTPRALNSSPVALPILPIALIRRFLPAGANRRCWPSCLEGRRSPALAADWRRGLSQPLTRSMLYFYCSCAASFRDIDSRSHN
jgi:hypothetical protein